MFSCSKEYRQCIKTTWSSHYFDDVHDLVQSGFYHFRKNGFSMLELKNVQALMVSGLDQGSNKFWLIWET